VLQPAPTSLGRATSLIRGIGGRAEGGNQGNQAWRQRAVLRAVLNATPGTSREAHATLGPRCGSSTAVPYMNCKDSTRQYAVDDSLLSCNSRLGHVPLG
jgi:hypothetical protein